MTDSIYIQHPQGYDGDNRYRETTKKLEEAGFIRLRSEKDKEGKYWEIWYLPGPWAARGRIEGLSHGLIISWVMNHIRPGEIESNGKHYGLSID